MQPEFDWCILHAWMLHSLGQYYMSHNARQSMIWMMLCCLQKDDGSSDTDAADPDKIAGLAAEFRRRANMLYTLLQSNKLQSSQRAPYLRQFLLRINYNGYVENEAVRQLRQGDFMTRSNV